MVGEGEEEEGDGLGRVWEKMRLVFGFKGGERISPVRRRASFPPEFFPSCPSFSQFRALSNDSAWKIRASFQPDFSRQKALKMTRPFFFFFFSLFFFTLYSQNLPTHTLPNTHTHTLTYSSLFFIFLFKKKIKTNEKQGKNKINRNISWIASQAALNFSRS